MQQTPAEVERKLERDRAEIDRTLEAIGERFTPGQLLDQAMRYVRANGGEMGSNLARTVKQNPFPLILTGVGLAWLMRATSSSRNGDGYVTYEAPGDESGRSTAGERARAAAARARAAADAVSRQADEAEEAFQERLTAAKAKALSMSREAGETAEAFRRRVEDYMADIEDMAAGLRHRAQAAWESGSQAVAGGARSVRAGAQGTQVRVREFYTSEPLIVGAIGVAAGALIGALIPSTRAEDRVIGELGDEVRDEAGEMANQAASVAGEAGKAAADAGKAAVAEGARAAAEKLDEAAQSAPKKAGGPGAERGAGRKPS